jgi:hypothetical protein
MRFGRENCLLVVLPAAFLVAGWMWIRPFSRPEFAALTKAQAKADGGPIRTAEATPTASDPSAPARRASLAPVSLVDHEANDAEEAVVEKWVATIVGFDGRPAKGAIVKVRWFFGTTVDGDDPLDPTKSFVEIYEVDEDGEVRVPLSLGWRFEACVEHEAYGRLRVPEFAATDKVVLPPPRSIEGRVVDENGRPMANAVVTVRDGVGDPIVVRTDENGRYRADGVGTGAVFVDVRHPAMRPESFAVQTEGVATLDVSARVGASANGVVASAPPVAPGNEGSVSLYDRWTRSIVEVKPLPENGDFGFDGLIPGRDYLAAVVRGGSTGEIAFRAGVSSPEVKLDEFAALVVAVEDDYGFPLPHAVVSLRRSDGLPADGVPYAVTDSDGVAVVSDVRPGVSFRAVVYAPGYAVYEFRNVVALPGERRQASCRLATSAPFSGRLVAVGGAPIAGAALRITRLDGYRAPPLFTYTDAEGAFEASGVAPGAISVGVMAPGYVYERSTIEVPPAPVGATDVVFIRAPAPTGIASK